MPDSLPSLRTRARRWYWKRVRRYRYEICGSVVAGTVAEQTIRRYGCGRPVGLVWRAETGFWHHMVTGELLPPDRIEGAGGILCVGCFDRLCNDRGEPLMWSAGEL